MELAPHIEPYREQIRILENRLKLLRTALEAIRNGYLGDLTAEQNFEDVREIARKALENDS